MSWPKRREDGSPTMFASIPAAVFGEMARRGFGWGVAADGVVWVQTDDGRLHYGETVARALHAAGWGVDLDKP